MIDRANWKDSVGYERNRVDDDVSALLDSCLAALAGCSDSERLGDDVGRRSMITIAGIRFDVIASAWQSRRHSTGIAPTVCLNQRDSSYLDDVLPAALRWLATMMVNHYRLGADLART